MKKLILVSIVLVSLASCEKLQNLNPFTKEKGESKNYCQVVPSDQLPTPVLTAFTQKYSEIGVSTVTWFNKDNTGFCASFSMNGKNTKALFDKNGNFISEAVENDNIDQTGEHNDVDTGCECELPENDTEKE